MTDDASPAPANGLRMDWAAQARGLVRSATAGTLATLDRDEGAPYASLVAVATLHDGRPLLLLSTLALHTRNATANPHVSLLLDCRDGAEDALARPRVTLMGELGRTQHPVARARYLARHPSAALYADFADFGFYELVVARGHFIGGFGRITPLSANELTEPIGDAQALVAAEASVLAHMNDDHADAVDLMARALGGARDGRWRLCGIDPTGCDLVGPNRGLRIPFPERVTSPNEIRQVLIALVAQARQV